MRSPDKTSMLLSFESHMHAREAMCERVTCFVACGQFSESLQKSALWTLESVCQMKSLAGVCWAETGRTVQQLSSGQPSLNTSERRSHICILQLNSLSGNLFKYQKCFERALFIRFPQVLIEP